MCRTTEFEGLYSRERRRLNIRAFYVRFIGLREPNKVLPESLTLLFPPRIDEADLSIGGSKVRPDSRAFVSLHRVVVGSGGEDAVFGSRERVRPSEGVRFEVFLREEKVLQGMFRRGEEEEEEGQEWKLEVRSGVEDGCEADVAVAEVCLGLEGRMALCERVEIARKKTKRRSGNRLEVIPEGREEEVRESDGLCCCCCDDGYRDGSDGWDNEGEDGEWEGCGPDCRRMEMDLEGVRWAVDVGIWVMCLGLGYLVSRASAKSVRRSLRGRPRIL